MNFNMDIGATASGDAALEVTYHMLSSLASTNGDDSEDSLMLGNCRKLAPAAVPRQKINARERYRTFNVNAAYEALRGLIPTEPVNRKLSKIEIIRLASSYITHLRSTLHTGTDRQPCLLHKWEQTQQPEGGSGVRERVNICTFCLKPKG
ncbi:hypothetical protein KR222_004473 [Zaprionus bogoriensis]|nr:hypothetical protein KR222_004473 [Zaprionus bogoriensis]